MNTIGRLHLTLPRAQGAPNGAAQGAPNGAAHGALHGAQFGAPFPAPPAAGAPGAPIAPCPPAKPGGHGGTAGRGPTRAGARAAPGNSAANGAAHGAQFGAPRGAPARARFVPLTARQARQALLAGSLNGDALDAEAVVYRLEEAGQTLLALPSTGWSTRLRAPRLDVVRNAVEGYGWENWRRDAVPMRAPVPDGERIDRMDEAMAWIPLIPRDRYVLRRIVGARSLVSPLTDRHLFSWRRLGTLLGADHKAIQRWHAQGIDLIVKALREG